MFNTFAEEAETQRARKESEREGEKERKNKREEREIAEGFGYEKIYEEPTRSSPVDSPVCTYDPKILRSFPPWSGEPRKSVALVARTVRPSRLLFATLERSGLSLFLPSSLSLLLVVPASSTPYQFIGFLAARTVITSGRCRAKCAPIELKIGF